MCACILVYLIKIFVVSQKPSFQLNIQHTKNENIFMIQDKILFEYIILKTIDYMCEIDYAATKNLFEMEQQILIDLNEKKYQQ